MKLRYKLLGGYLVIIVLALILCLLALNGYRTVYTHLVTITEDILPGYQAMTSMKLSALTMVVEARDYLRTDDEMHVQYARENMGILRESLRAHLEHEAHIGDEEKGAAENMERKGLRLIDLCNSLIDSHQRGASEETLSKGRKEISLCKDELLGALDEHLVVHSQELLDAQTAIYQTIVDGFWMFLVISILVLALGLVIALRTVRLILEPVDKLKTGAEVIGSGDLDYRLDIKTGDEIEQLAVSFNGMADRLADMVNTLEQRVAERTAELTTANEQLQRQVAERRRSEEALQESEEKLRKMSASAQDAIVMMDNEGNISFWNEAAEEIFGYSSQEALGKELHALVAPEHYHEAYREGFARFKTTGQGAAVGKTLELTAVRKDGTVFPIELALSAVRLKGKWNAIGIMRDITERRQAEEALREAKEAAEAATQSKSEFLANMSHEIRTPMNAVIGMTGLLLDTPLDQEQRDYVETIRGSGDALLTIINDILDFSKIEAGKLELEFQPFDLPACVEQALDLLASKTADKGIELAYLIDPEVPLAFEGDVTRLRQILVNLLSNAVKFTEEGEVVVSVSGRPLPSPPQEGGYELHFAVRDTGIGIPESRRDRLFQSFSQVDTSTTRRYGGTGLGLVISKRLVEMMGGTIWAESEVGKGSTFHFTIVAQAAPSQERLYPRGLQPQLAGKQVLIVDDNETNRQIITKQTESWGMLPRAAASGPKALEWIRWGDPFDIAILDMQMPEMDGLTLAAEIRKHRAPQTLPLMMLSSMSTRKKDVPEGLFAAHLTKPVRPSQLHDALVGVFAGQAAPVRRTPSQPQIDHEMAQRHPLHILLAEDNVINQKVALLILEQMGYRADVAANGQEALQAVERQPYDVILMDVQMPEMDGVEATRHIRERWSPERQPRIIAMTAHALAGDREQFLAAGMDDYVSKPVRIEEVMQALHRCRPLASRTAESPAEEAVPQSPPAIDVTVLEELGAMVGDDTLAELIVIFPDDTSRLLVEIRQAMVQEDAEKLQRAAHTLEGTSATLGALPLAALCQELETMSRKGRLEEVAEQVVQIEAESERVKSALETAYQP